MTEPNQVSAALESGQTALRDVAVPAPLRVGIDLGTTQSVVAVAQGSEPVQVLPLSQWVNAGQVAELPNLASVLLARSEAEASADAKAVAGLWDDPLWISGDWARRRAVEQPNRAVVSAKSWLCHAGVDREANILPWQRSSEAVDSASVGPKMSPVEASSRLLGHIKHALELRYGAQLASARIVLTIPASFDQVARGLTLRAANAVGLNVELLEEPQAAFYDAVVNVGRRQVLHLLSGAASKRVLVIDVGGGTTDLALFEMKLSADATADGNQVRFSRLAVGRHLLLGGDNVDLALAARLEASFAEKLDSFQSAQLVLQARAAKERLLSEALHSIPIAIARSGAALVGGVLRTELSRALLSEVLFDGFLPAVQPRAQRRTAGNALRGAGLPYEREPAITRHIVEFVERKQAEFGLPELLLFNGGLFHSSEVRARVKAVLETALERPLTEVANSRPDTAVARGAVAYATARAGDGVLIDAVSPHGYYVALGGKQHGKALCVVPRGAREGALFRPEQDLNLTVGRAVRFELYSSEGQRHASGEIVDIAASELLRLPALKVTLPSVGAASGAAVAVRLSGTLSAIGTLKLQAEEREHPELVHALEFELRAELALEAEARKVAEVRSEADKPKSAAPRSGGLPAAATELLGRIYGKGRSDVASREVKDLSRELERLLGPRASWSLSTLRELADVLLESVRARRRSQDHERNYFQLLGFALRPGFGDSGDAARVETVGGLFHEGLAFDSERKQWEAFLIAFRRVAPGLTEARQTEIRQQLDPFLAPSDRKLKKPKGFRPQGEDDVLWLAASLERIATPERAALGQWILDRTWTSRAPHYWEMLARIGARVPLYASAHFALEPRVVERWLSHLLSEKWETLSVAAKSAATLARFTDDRERDLPLSVRKEVAQRLEKVAAPEALRRMVLEYVPVAAAERLAALLDDAPIGLTLPE